jgi:hypothetical protein
MPTPETFDEAGTLLQATIELLQKDSRNLMEIMSYTGLPLYWLRDMRAGTIANPSVNRVQFLYERLSGKKLKI